MLKKIYIIICAFILLYACKSDDDNQGIVNNSFIYISSIALESNTKDALIVNTVISAENLRNISIDNHGISLYKNDQLILTINQGKLTEKRFQTVINTHMVKGEKYVLVPFILNQHGYTYGNPLNIVSNLEINAKITDFSPSNAFVYDTLYIKGKEFCESISNNTRNFMNLGESQHDIVFESDTLLKAVIRPFLTLSESKVVINTCGIDVSSSQNFAINPPVLDSLSSEAKYVNDTHFIYGENFHANISTVWINNTEVTLNKQRTDTNKLEFTIPHGLPSGKLDVKIQVIDKIIEKNEFYQSTSPVINELDKVNTGFLDTLTIKGNYLIQSDSEPEVLIGNREQRIIEKSDNEIKIIIDGYFFEESPVLTLKTGTFEIEYDNIIILPPQIISVDKNVYNLQDDTVILKTKYFLEDFNDILVGSATFDYFSATFEPIDSEGNVIINLNDWFQLNKLNPSSDFRFTEEENGEIEIEITTPYGAASTNIKILPPEITSINQVNFFHNDKIIIEGDNFGYHNVTDIYVDDVLVEYTGVTNFEMKNKIISFVVPNTLYPGSHKLKLVTGGQASNEIDFNIEEVTPQSLDLVPGTRNDLFTIYGDNLSSSVRIEANGVYCEVKSVSSTEIQFELHHSALFKEKPVVTAIYGPEVFDLGELNLVEPYESIIDYNKNAPSRRNGYFEYNNNLYILNPIGIYEYNMNTSTWDIYESNMNAFEYSIKTQQLFVVGSKIHILYADNVLVYDMETREWDTKNILLDDGISILKAIVTDDNTAYIFEKKSQYNNVFYKYNFDTQVKEDLQQPAFLSTYSNLVDELYYYDNKIYFDVFDNDILVYDIINNNWETIHYPSQLTYRQFTNLYVYKNILYLSGGTGNGFDFHDIYAYSFTSKEWIEKTHLPDDLQDHIIFGLDDKLYITLGGGLYGYDQESMYIYDINKDLH